MVDPQIATDPRSYALPTCIYIYQESYGSPEVDHVECKIIRAEVAADQLTVRLFVVRLHEGHVHELHLDGVRSSQGKPRWHPVGYYTLNYIPEKAK